MYVLFVHVDGTRFIVFHTTLFLDLLYIYKSIGES